MWIIAREHSFGRVSSNGPVRMPPQLLLSLTFLKLCRIFFCMFFFLFFPALFFLAAIVALGLAPAAILPALCASGAPPNPPLPLPRSRWRPQRPKVAGASWQRWWPRGSTSPPAWRTPAAPRAAPAGPPGRCWPPRSSEVVEGRQSYWGCSPAFGNVPPRNFVGAA